MSDSIRRIAMTSIPYVNGRPTSALPSRTGRCLVRHHRLKGDSLSGLMRTPSPWFSRRRCRVSIWRRWWPRTPGPRIQGPLDVHYDDFIRTSTDPRHSPRGCGARWMERRITSVTTRQIRIKYERFYREEGWSMRVDPTPLRKRSTRRTTSCAEQVSGSID